MPVLYLSFEGAFESRKYAFIVLTLLKTHIPVRKFLMILLVNYADNRSVMSYGSPTGRGRIWGDQFWAEGKWPDVYIKIVFIYPFDTILIKYRI